MPHAADRHSDKYVLCWRNIMLHRFQTIVHPTDFSPIASLGDLNWQSGIRRAQCPNGGMAGLAASESVGERTKRTYRLAKPGLRFAVQFAIVGRPWGYAFMVIRRWATRDLRRGDLTALAEIAKGWAQPTDSCIQRLKRRHFILVKSDGQVVLTFRGHLAVRARHLGRH